jgi:hypothetical protein
MHLRIMVAVSGLLLTACASDVRLRHPQTGKVAVCEGGYSYGIYAHFTQQKQFRCIDDFQRQGYERESG